MANAVDRIGRMNKGAHELADTFGVTIVWAAIFEFIKMVSQGHATVEDILLLSPKSPTY